MGQIKANINHTVICDFVQFVKSHTQYRGDRGTTQYFVDFKTYNGTMVQCTYFSKQSKCDYNLPYLINNDTNINTN